MHRIDSTGAASATEPVQEVFRRRQTFPTEAKIAMGSKKNKKLETPLNRIRHVVPMNTRTASIIVVISLVAVGLVAFLNKSNGSGILNGGGEKIQWHTFDEGVALAAKEHKKVLIDVYTDWCVWCKKMDSDVYTNEGVGKVIASNFIAVKLNAESSKALAYNGEKIDETTFARAMGVTGYPTTVFLEPGARPITKIPGFVEAKEFAQILRFIGKDHYKTKTFDEYKKSIGSSGS